MKIETDAPSAPQILERNVDKITFKTPITMEIYAFNFTLFSTTNVVFAIWNGKKKKLGIISRTAQR